MPRTVGSDNGNLEVPPAAPDVVMSGDSSDSLSLDEAKAIASLGDSSVVPASLRTKADNMVKAALKPVAAPNEATLLRASQAHKKACAQVEAAKLRLEAAEKALETAKLEVAERETKAADLAAKVDSIKASLLGPVVLPPAFVRTQPPTESLDVIFAACTSGGLLDADMLKARLTTAFALSTEPSSAEPAQPQTATLPSDTVGPPVGAGKAVAKGEHRTAPYQATPAPVAPAPALSTSGQQPG